METLRKAREMEFLIRANLESALEERDDLVRSLGPTGLKLMERIDSLTIDKNAAKGITNDAYDIVRDTALITARDRLAKGVPLWGRGLHPNLQVQKGVELDIINLGSTVMWLQLVGMENVVSISMRGNTAFFRNAVPPQGTFSLVTIPLIRIDKEIIPLPKSAVKPPALDVGM